MSATAAGLIPFRGDCLMKVPCWAVRPGGVDVLYSVRRDMDLWLAISSVNGAEMTPCTCSEETLALTIGLGSRQAVRRRLERLRSVPGLLFEQPLGRHKDSYRFLTISRFAADPARMWYLKRSISHRLEALAETYGLESDWLYAAQVRLEEHSYEAAQLACRIADNLLDISPTRVTKADTMRGGVMGSGRKKPRRKAGKKKQRTGRTEHFSGGDNVR